MKKLILLALLTTACTASPQQKQMERAEELCMAGAVKDYKGRTKDSWVEISCRG